MRQLQKLAIAASIAAIGALGLPGLAGAAGSNAYPGTTTTTSTTAPTNNTTTTIASGSATVNFGAFVVGNTFSGTFCGFAAGATVTLTMDGTVDATVTAGANGCVTFTVTISDPHAAINGGTPIPASFGQNTIVGTGASAGGGTQTDTGVFTILTAAAPSEASEGLAFTGADISAMVVGGLALIAFGFLVLTFTRRRKATSI